MENILIVGAGNLGRRHFQSLAAFPREATIQVLDTSSAALALAKDLFNSTPSNPNLKVEYISTFKEVNKDLSIAIIATSSVHRLGVMESLLDHASIRYMILEKFLFTKPEEFHKADELISGNNIETWVNCPRRLFPFYENLKDEIKGPIYMNVFGSNWGLACNSIHFLDLHYFLSDSGDLYYTADSHFIDNQIFSSKREGYIEFMGSLDINSSDTSRLQFTCLTEGSVPLSINLESPSHKMYINEGAPGKVLISRERDNWSWKNEDITVLFQSQLTSEVVKQILDSGNCSLPEYRQSRDLHLVLLNAFIDKSKEILTSNEIDQCLIT